MRVLPAFTFDLGPWWSIDDASVRREAAWFHAELIHAGMGSARIVWGHGIGGTREMEAPLERVRSRYHAPAGVVTESTEAGEGFVVGSQSFIVDATEVAHTVMVLELPEFGMDVEIDVHLVAAAGEFDAVAEDYFRLVDTIALSESVVRLHEVLIAAVQADR